METETDNERKKFVIKIHGRAYSKDKTSLEQVKTFDDFVNELFKEFKSKLKEKFDTEKELGYEMEDPEKNEMIDPFVYRFELDTVTKDIRASD